MSPGNAEASGTLLEGLEATNARLDRLTRTCVELAAEVWTLRDRLTIVEHLLETRGGLRRAEVDAFRPEGTLAEELAAQRAAFADRLVGLER